MNKFLSILLALIVFASLNGCAVVAIADATVSVASTVVKVGATVVGTTVNIAASGVRKATDN